MLKMTGVELEQISNIYMHLFIEKGLRGGISYIAKRYSEANSKYLKNYDPTRPSKYIEHLDENNLYGWAVSGCLSYALFKWWMKLTKIRKVLKFKQSDWMKKYINLKNKK